MAGEWPELTLEECMDAIIDYRGKTPRKTESGIPLVTAKIIKGGRVEKPEEFIDPADYDDWMRRGIPKAGDIVLTTEAPLGEVAQLDGRKIALAQRVITLRGKSGVVDNTFLKFLLQSKGVQEQLKGRSTGTTVHGIRQSELRKVLLPVPSIVEQRAIAHSLGTLDDKIELNRKMNETLEAIAQVLFKSWFVDAIEEGLPDEWRIGTLRDIADNPRRGIEPDEISPSTPYIGLEHMPRHCVGLSDWGCAGELGSNKFVFNRGEILFGKLRPYFHKVGVAPLDGVCSTDILVVVPKEPEWFGFTLGHVSSVDFVNHSDASSTGTRMPRTSWQNMARYEVALPPKSVAAAYNEQVRPLVERIVANIHELRTLAAIRDALLPKLMIGEIRLGSGGIHETE